MCHQLHAVADTDSAAVPAPIPRSDVDKIQGLVGRLSELMERSPVQTALRRGATTMGTFSGVVTVEGPPTSPRSQSFSHDSWQPAAEVLPSPREVPLLR